MSEASTSDVITGPAFGPRTNVNQGHEMHAILVRNRLRDSSSPYTPQDNSRSRYSSSHILLGVAD